MSVAGQADQVPQEKLDLYEKLIATHPEIERKGKTMPYTSVNGHMFSHLSKSGELGLRLPAEARETFMRKYNTGLFVQHGAVMKEYVTVPDELLVKTDELAGHLRVSYEYAKSLKPK